MKKILFVVYLLVSAFIGASIMVSCDKGKEQETIDYQFFEGNWEVIESNELAESGLFVVGDVIDISYGMGGVTMDNIHNIGWEGKRGDKIMLFSGLLDDLNNKIYEVGGYITQVGVPFKASMRDEEYGITKLDKFEMVLKRTAPSNNQGTVVLNKKYSSHYYK